MRLNLFQKGLILVSIPLCFEITIFGVLLNLQNQAELAAQKVSRHKQINDALNFILRKTLILGKARTAEFTSLAYKDNLAEIFVNLDRLSKLTENDPDLSKNVVACEISMRAAERELNYIQRALRTGSAAESEGISDARAKLYKDVQDAIGADFMALADKSSQGIDDDRSRQLRERIKQLLRYALGLSVLMGVAGAAIFSQQLVERLNRLSSNAARLARGEPLPLVDRGADEVAELDRSFHYAANAIADATRMRREVTAMITHDLKTPLQSIKSFLEMLRHGLLAKLNSRGERLLEHSEHETMRMVSLIDSVLQLEKLRSGKVSLRLEKTEIGAMIEIGVDAVQTRAQEKSIELKREYGQYRHESIEADKFLLQQILVNILSNAIKFSPPNTFIVIAIQATNSELIIRISDKGPGIPEPERKLVFERFHRARSVEGNAVGSGLGLAISKELIELHHGSVEVEDTEGSGSTFSIHLPRSPAVKQCTI